MSRSDVRELRALLALTQAGFAHFMRVSVRAVQRWEVGGGELDIPPFAQVKIRIYLLSVAIRGDEFVEEVRACLQAAEDEANARALERDARAARRELAIIEADDAASQVALGKWTWERSA